MRRRANLLSGKRASRITSAGIVVALIILIISIIATVSYWDCLSADESLGSKLRNVAVIIAGLVAFPLAIARILVVGGQADTAERSLANDRYQRGAEMLGHEQEIVRIGGIDALREVAQQYPDQYVRPAMRLLCAFLKKHCGNARRIPKFSNRPDLQAAMEAVASFGPEQRGTYHDPDNRHSVNLGGISLFDGVFARMNLAGLNFQNSGFDQSSLKGTNFSAADLRQSSFQTVNMLGTILEGAQIDGALFSRHVTGLTQRQLYEARTSGDNAPSFEGTRDADTGKLLVWNPS